MIKKNKRVNMDCVFCKIINGDLPACRVYEDDSFLAILDIMPVNYGHTLVIPKEHFKHILDMPDDYTESIYKVVKKISHAIKEALQCDGLNIIQNVEKAGGQEVYHSHLHIIPRYLDDSIRLSLNKKKYENNNAMQLMAEKISQFLSE
jgi:histidine triad (HIT) family protein